MRNLICILVFVAMGPQFAIAQGPTEDGLTKLIHRLIELDSMTW